MSPLLIVATVWLIAVFGVFWHDEPANERSQRNFKAREPHSP